MPHQRAKDEDSYGLSSLALFTMPMKNKIQSRFLANSVFSPFSLLEAKKLMWQVE
jgi:hypothetical protein